MVEASTLVGAYDAVVGRWEQKYDVQAWREGDTVHVALQFEETKKKFVATSAGSKNVDGQQTEKEKDQAADREIAKLCDRYERRRYQTTAAVPLGGENDRKKNGSPAATVLGAQHEPSVTWSVPVAVDGASQKAALVHPSFGDTLALFVGGSGSATSSAVGAGAAAAAATSDKNKIRFLEVRDKQGVLQASLDLAEHKIQSVHFYPEFGAPKFHPTKRQICFIAELGLEVVEAQDAGASASASTDAEWSKKFKALAEARKHVDFGEKLQEVKNPVVAVLDYADALRFGSRGCKIWLQFDDACANPLHFPCFPSFWRMGKTLADEEEDSRVLRGDMVGMTRYEINEFPCGLRAATQLQSPQLTRKTFGYHAQMQRGEFVTDDAFVYETLHKGASKVFVVRMPLLASTEQADWCLLPPVRESRSLTVPKTDSTASPLLRPVSEDAGPDDVLRSVELLHCGEGFVILQDSSFASFAKLWLFEVLKEGGRWHLLRDVSASLGSSSFEFAKVDGAPHCALFAENHNAVGPSSGAVLLPPSFATSAASRSISRAAAPAGPPHLNGLVLCLHGGPHGVSAPVFSPLHVIVPNLLNMAMFYPNYTGSVSFSREFADELLGKAGELDVVDCERMTQKLLAELGHLTGGKKNIPVFVMGGSHGGFLTAHLVGRNKIPNIRAGIMRNPVTDLEAMVRQTDIPEWIFAEGLKRVCYNFLELTEQDCAELKKKSPVTSAKSVCCDVLMLLGDKDLRVPMGPNGQAYMRLLDRIQAERQKRGRGTQEQLQQEFRTEIFEGEGHGFEKEQFVAKANLLTLEWFRKKATTSRN
eukprot:g9140.t1